MTMLAVGCFLPFATLTIGAILGSYMGSIRGGYWGAGAGLGVGLLVVVAGFAMLSRVRKGR